MTQPVELIRIKKRGKGPAVDVPGDETVTVTTYTRGDPAYQFQAEDGTLHEGGVPLRELLGATEVTLRSHITGRFYTIRLDHLPATDPDNTYVVFTFAFRVHPAPDGTPRRLVWDDASGCAAGSCTA